MKKKSIVTAVLVALAVLAAILAGGWFFLQADKQPPHVSPPTTTQAAPTTTTEEQPEPPSPNDGPAPSGVGSFTFEGAVSVTGATYDSMPYVLPLNPAGPQDTMVRWVDGWGQSPTTAEDGTTYVLGHAWGQQKLVFNPISELVTATADRNNPVAVPSLEAVPVYRYFSTALNGSVITMADATGSRQWEVTTAYLVNKDAAAYDEQLIDEFDPGRIVLIACAVEGGVDLDYNVIVEGRLL